MLYIQSSTLQKSGSSALHNRIMLRKKLSQNKKTDIVFDYEPLFILEVYLENTTYNSNDNKSIYAYHKT